MSGILFHQIRLADLNLTLCVRKWQFRYLHQNSLCLSLEEKEDGEIQKEESQGVEEGNIEEEDGTDIREEDLLEDEILEQKDKDKEKSAVQKGGGGERVQKARAQDVNPKSKRSSRRKL